jgi:hypothetical protein
MGGSRDVRLTAGWLVFLRCNNSLKKRCGIGFMGLGSGYAWHAYGTLEMISQITMWGKAYTCHFFLLGASRSV